MKYTLTHVIFHRRYNWDMQLKLGQGVRFQTKQEFVYQTLRDAIISCEIPPGTRLVIEDIAQRLSISPIPVREALQLLQSDRLVESTPHIGATVANISQDSITEVFTLMEGLEVITTRAATQKMTADAMKEIKECVSKMDAAISKKDYQEWLKLNGLMHDVIAKTANMPMVHDMLSHVLTHWKRLRNYYFEEVVSSRLTQAQQEHHEMVKFMQEKNYAALEQSVRSHNQHDLQAYTQHLAKQEGL